MNKFIFGKIGESFFEVRLTDESKIETPEGFVIIDKERPDVNYIVKNNGNGRGEWVIAPDEVPQILSRFQAMTILKLTKLSNEITLYQSVDSYINSLSDDSVENITAKTAWETAQEFRRDSVLIKLAQGTYKLTDDQVDEMFISASKITA